MVLPFWTRWVLVSLLLNLSQQDDDFNKGEFNNLLYQTKGSVSILGVFENYFGADCKLEVEKGMEEIASAVWTVETLNNYQYLPGITIGLTIFGVCERFNNRQVLLENLEQHLQLNRDNNYIGILTSQEIHKNMPPLKSISKSNILHIEHIISVGVMTDAVIQLLINLQWMSVNSVISDSPDILKLFREKALEEGIVTRNELLINSSWVNMKDPGKIKISSVTVMIASFANISNIFKLSSKSIKLILSPTDFVFDTSLLDLPNDTIVSLPSVGNKTALSKYIKNVFRHKKLFNQKHPQGPLFIGTAASVLKLLKPFKSLFEKNCQNTELNLQQPCAAVAYFINEVWGNKTGLLSQKSMKISPDDVEETLKVLKIEASSNDEMFLYISSVINDNTSEDLAIFKIFSLKTRKFQPILAMINDNSLKNHRTTNTPKAETGYFSRIFKSSTGETQTLPNLGKPVFNSLKNSLENAKTLNKQSEDNTSLAHLSEKKCESQDPQSQMCLNLAINYSRVTQKNETTKSYEVEWRFLAWVSVNTSIGFVGVTCTLSTMLFLIIRLCKRDILEGAPYFTLLLMISVILTYVSSLPFHVEFSSGEDFICHYRKYGPPIVFAILFSLLLSRSILLAFQENREEFSGHLNGYLQSILCIFMLGIQVSLIAQNWILENNLSWADEHNKYEIFFSLCYDFLLLILLACVSPFILRSNQNYKEGLLISIAVFFITVVWSAWISFYVLLPNEDKDAAIAIGLNTTASVFLFCIFIPQTYFMAEPLDREAGLHSFSSLDRNILSNTNFKSRQSLNENAFGTIIYKNCESGVSNPNFFTSHPNESDSANRIDNFSGETDIPLPSGTSQAT